MPPVLNWVFALVASSFALSARADALFVAGAVPVSSADATAVGRLQQLGHAVTVVKDSASTAASANGMALVIISDSVNPGNVSNKFTQVSVPVIVYEPWLYDNLGLTGAVATTDYGAASSQTQLRMTGTHPLTGGLTGKFAVASAASKFSWGKPGGAAVVAATLGTNSTRPAIFAYEAGASLFSGSPAPARRVAFYPNTGAINSWTSNGQKLFDAAVQWAGNGGPPPAAAVRILPLGDSITAGSAGHWTCRRDLEAALTGANCSFDLVGSRFGPTSGPGSPLFDRDHEGHGGYKTYRIRTELPQWLPGYEFDWALIHVGTNDVLQGVSLSAIRSNISSIIGTLRAANPNVGILLAQIIPNRPVHEAAVAALNDAIVALAAQKNQPSVSPVIVVDHYSGYSTFTHNYDEIHPNEAGEALMAERWFQALLPRIAEHCGP
jgi:acyl-CoA thioesterase I